MQVDQSVLAVLSTANVSGNAVVLTGQLDRKMYEKVNKVLDAAGGKWNRKEKAHVFDGEATDRIDQILLTGSIDIPKDEFNYFPTPAAVVDVLLDKAALKTGMRVLEPSAGRGAIASACVDAGAIVDCVELMDANFASLSAVAGLNVVLQADFLTMNAQPVYHRVVMNPPFLKQADIRHVTHALSFLAPGGLLVAVMSAGVEFRDNRLTKEFRMLVDERGGYIEPLPSESFRSSGTAVNTVVVVIPA